MSSGWSNMGGMTRKYHHFENGLSFDKSACGRYMLAFTQKLDEGNDESPDNCAVCKKKVKAASGGEAKG